MEWSGQKDRSQQFFFLSPSTEGRERKNGRGGERLCGRGRGTRAPLRNLWLGSYRQSEVKLVQGQFTLGIPSASPIRKSIS